MIVMNEPRTSPAERVGKLRALVGQNRRRWTMLSWLEALGWAVALPLASLWVMVFIDSRWHLPRGGRLVAGLFVLVVAIMGLVRLARRARLTRLSEDEVALAIERRTPQSLHNRLINAVQLARSSATAPELHDAVLQENVAELSRATLEDAAPSRPAFAWLGIAAAMIGVGVGFWLWHPERFTSSATRIFLPLAEIEPFYRTRLIVEPGNIEAVGDVPMRVAIEGERPAALTVVKKIGDKTHVETIAVDLGGEPVTFLLRDVRQTITYTVSGGDSVSPTYTITVPRQTTLARVKATYHFPSYVKLPAKSTEIASGDLEALQDSRVHVVYVFDAPLDHLAWRADKNLSAPQLTRSADGREWSGQVALAQGGVYRLEMEAAGRPKQVVGPFRVNVVTDHEPKLELLGADRSAEATIDTPLSLTVIARDDLGLKNVGLVYRRLGEVGADGKKDQPWQPLQSWAGEGKALVRQGHELSFLRLALAEGDALEIAPRAQDFNPERGDGWTLGPVVELVLGGEGVGLELAYHNILASQAELAQLLKEQKVLTGSVVDWLKKLDGLGDLRWDDPKNLASLHQAVAGLEAGQKALHAKGAKAAQAMPVVVGNLRVAVGLLSDTEMVRAARILSGVAGRDTPGAKRAALADARVTQDRIARSLEELAKQYAVFRSDWELAHMIPFTKMLADRQTKLRDVSKGLAAAVDVSPDQQTSMHRRQTKVVDVSGLMPAAFVSLSRRLDDTDASLAKAFADGAKTLIAPTFRDPMIQAAEAASQGRWSEVVREQTKAAQAWADLHGKLRQVQVDAAQKALAALKEKAKSNLEAQKELDQLAPGTAEAAVKNFPKDLTLEDTMRIWEIAAGKKKTGDTKDGDFDLDKANLIDIDAKSLELSKDSGVRQDTSLLKLGNVPEKTGLLDLPKDKTPNAVQPFIQEKFDDLVGKLLDETEDLSKKYQSLTLSTNQNNNDPGEINKEGGSLNSTGAVAATGNKKPPNTEGGGVSRTGRQGARATGMVADQDVMNHRGRDKALEGTERIPDQPGVNKMKKSDDPQTDFSTGVGGKKIESDDNHFSLHDAGKWKDDMLKRMEKPQEKHYIVERQSDKFSAQSAAQLRDLTSKQEQVIERLKAIKKELKNLYLPTEHLDDLTARLHANLESLKDRPDADLFRLQGQTLDRLRGALRVFQGANAGLQPSLPRDRQIRDRVLDDPNRPALPGYEDAVRQYYLKLSIAP